MKRKSTAGKHAGEKRAARKLQEAQRAHTTHPKPGEKAYLQLGAVPDANLIQEAIALDQDNAIDGTEQAVAIEPPGAIHFEDDLAIEENDPEGQL